MSLQWYENVPAVLNVTEGDDEPAETIPSQPSKGLLPRVPSVVVCETLPLLFQVMVSPSVTVIAEDEKKKFSMSTVKAAASAGLVGRSA